MTARSIPSQVLRLVRYSLAQPVGRRYPIRTIGRILRWQILSRMSSGSREVEWIDGAKLVMRRHMPGASGNLYFGLHEFPDMSFFLHLLQPGDLFLDIGANVGTYTVLASRLCGAETWAFEPDAETASILLENVRVNAIESHVRCVQTALGNVEGEIRFTTGLGPMNRVANESDSTQRTVDVITLDRVLRGRTPIAMKLDVEGFEHEVLLGAAGALSHPGLLAIEIETVVPESEELLHRLGFSQYYYHPFTRALDCSPNEFRASNALYLRDLDLDLVRERVALGRARNVMGLVV